MKKIIKSLLSLIIVVCLIFGTAPFAIFDVFNFTILPNIFAPKVFAANYSGKCGENLTWELDTSTGLLTISGKGDMTNWSSNYEGSPWYEYRTLIKKIVIGNSVTSLGDGAFFDCNNLTDVTIPSSVKIIGYAVFFYCTSLKSVTIPKSVTTIEVSAFENCTSLKTVTISNSVKTIAMNAFVKCTSLTKIVLPNSVISIGRGVFLDCTNLIEAVLPTSIKTIAPSMFYNCQKLKSITIPNSVTSIEKGAFSGCTSLISVKIPKSVTSIGQCGFCKCTSLKNVYYSGTKAQWNKISFGSHNDYLKNSTLHFAQGVTQTQPKPTTTKPTTTKPTTTKPTTTKPTTTKPTTTKPATTKPATTKPATTKPAVPKEDNTVFNSIVPYTTAPIQIPSSYVSENETTETYMTTPDTSEPDYNYSELFFEEKNTEDESDGFGQFVNGITKDFFNDLNTEKDRDNDIKFEWWYWFIITAAVSFITGVLLIIFNNKKH